MSLITSPKLLRYRRTKIVATLGPASSDRETLDRLIRAGVDLFRMNMSHGSHESHRETYALVREAERASGRPVAVMADLCGPKIRTGRLAEGALELRDGASVTVTTRDVVGGGDLIASQYESLADDVVPGSRILLDDGNLELRVEAVDGTEIACTVVAGGVLKERKGMNLPGVEISAPSLTDKDREDARFALELGVDFLALSFVRRASDVADLRNLMGDAAVGIVSKIEKPEALENIEEILEHSDAIMVARGDLGVELPPEMVPLAQERLIELGRSSSLPVIVATQMLESMIDNPRPTRAEVSDVATAVRSSADAVMLSAETAVGRHPITAVQIMDRVIRQSEANQWRESAFGSLSDGRPSRPPPLSFEEALASATSRLSRDLRVRAIAVVSSTGQSLAVVSSSRPAAPIIVLTSDDVVSHMACLRWACIPALCSPEELDEVEDTARRRVLEFELADPGHVILVVRGFSRDPAHNRPSVTIVSV